MVSVRVRVRVGVDIGVRDASRVAALDELDGVEHAAHLQLVDDALAVQLLRR